MAKTHDEAGAGVRAPGGPADDGLPTVDYGTLFGGRAGGTGRLSVLVVGEGIYATHPLPPSGSIVLGRSERADVRIEDPSISRRHAVLHLDPPIRIEDLGSANGVRVRGAPIAPGETVEVGPGEAIDLGGVSLLLQRGPGARPRRLWTHGYFEARIEEECARAERSGSTFAVLRLHVAGDLPRGMVEQSLAGSLRSYDLVGTYAPSEYEILLVDTPPAGAAKVAEQLRVLLSGRGAEIRIGVAHYPLDGRTADVLLAKACGSVEGQSQAASRGETGAVIVSDPAMQRLHGLVERVAGGDISVILLGETGVGKEVIAATLHDRSPRRKLPLVRINCAALSESLVESELFGHERGAFTGAMAAKPGLLEAAHGGTVFLDEVGELPLPLQAKLLRVLEDRQIRPVGALKSHPIDVRFVAATNRDLETEVHDGRFRQDLFFRLNGVSIVIPPLRARPAEIEPLARAFVAQAAQRAGRPIPLLTDPTLALLRAYSWPGNIRELKNVIDRALVLCTGNRITPEHLPLEKMGPNDEPIEVPVVLPPAPKRPREVPAGPSAPPPGEAGARETAPMDLRSELEALERQRIVDALERCAGNQTKAAKLLGLSRRSLLTRLEAYNVPRPRKGATEPDPAEEGET